MQAATRMGDGQWPWRDFGWAYGPGEPLVVMAPLKAFGPSLLWWRLLRVAADADRRRCSCGRSARDERPRWASRPGPPPRSSPPSPTARTRRAGARVRARRRPARLPRGHPRGLGRRGSGGRGFWRPDVGATAALAAMAPRRWRRGKAVGTGEARGSASSRLGPRARRRCAVRAVRDRRRARRRSGRRWWPRRRATASGGGCRSPTASMAATRSTSCVAAALRRARGRDRRGGAGAQGAAEPCRPAHPCARRDRVLPLASRRGACPDAARARDRDRGDRGAASSCSAPCSR